MSDLGVISTNYHHASMLIMPYARALESIRSSGGRLEGRDKAKSLLDVLVPLDRHLRGVSHFALVSVDAWSMSKFLRLHHRENWQAVRDGIVSVTAAIEGGGGRTHVGDGDALILGYVADALENECASLFEEMRRR